MGRQRLIQILLLSLCAHLVVFWPLPLPRMVLPEPSKRLQVRITQVEGPVVADIAERPSGQEDNLAVVPVRPPQPGGGLDHRSQKYQALSQAGGVRSDQVSRGVVQETSSALALEDRGGSLPDLQAYKFAVASAALASRPQKNGELVLNGIVVVDIHLTSATGTALVSLADSSGVDAVDTLALQMVQHAVERVAIPALGREQGGRVRLSVVFEPEGP